MTKGPLYAYSCSTNDPEDARIVFARCHSEARRSYFDETGNPPETEIVRKPSYDRHAPGPVPPLALIDDGWYFECSQCSRRISLDETGYERMTQAEIAAMAGRHAVIRRRLAEFERDDPEPVEPPVDSPSNIKWAWKQKVAERNQRRRSISHAIDDHPLSKDQIVEVGGEVFCDRRCHLEHAEKVADIDLAHAEAEREAERRWPGSPSYQSRRWPYLEPSVTFHPPGFDHPVTWSVSKDEIYRSATDMERWNALDEGKRDEDA